jgi:glutathione synthase/RimK-type ligase-like ATP-grasp enzyme
VKVRETVFMNKLCVIAKNKETYFIKRLIEEVGQEVAFFNPWSDFELPVADKYLVRTTGVVRNDLDLMILTSLPEDKIINPLPVLKLFRSKRTQYEWFDQNDIPSLPWIALAKADLIFVERFFRLYPHAVVKPLNGQGGWGIEVLRWESFKTWWKKKKGVDEDYLLQPLIKGAKELRYFFIKGRAPVVLERKSVSGVAANFQSNGKAEISHLPIEFEAQVQNLIQQSGALYGAIDLFIQDGRVIILELNSVPGIEQLEKVTSSNIMKALIEDCFMVKNP